MQNNNEYKINGRGGKRPGAGRKKLENAHVKTVSISGSELEILKLKKLASGQKKSFSRFIIETILYGTEN